VAGGTYLCGDKILCDDKSLRGDKQPELASTASQTPAKARLGISNNPDRMRLRLIASNFTRRILVQDE